MWYIAYFFAENNIMQRIIGLYRYFSDRRYSTIAGTLVYFLLMSITPLFFWFTLLLGNIDIGRFLSHSLLQSVQPFIGYVKSSAQSAVGGAGIALLATTLYSSTNFFFHLRRSGEIIYDCPRAKGGIKLRLVSLLFIFSSILLTAVVTAVSVAGSKFLDNFMPKFVSDIISCVFLAATAFTIALVLNLFACPYRIKAEEAVPGSLLTTALWLIFAIGFAVYLQFATPERLYGKIASIFVFLLWCYLMMSSFVMGVIYNGSFLSRRAYKKHL